MNWLTLPYIHANFKSLIPHFHVLLLIGVRLIKALAYYLDLYRLINNGDLDYAI